MPMHCSAKLYTEFLTIPPDSFSVQVLVQIAVQINHIDSYFSSA